MQYKIHVSKDNAGYIAMCHELPNFVATSPDLDGLSRMAVKNLTLIVGSHLSMGKAIPEGAITLDPDNVWYPPLCIRLKVAVSNTLIQKGWSREDFARAMDLTPASMNNFFNIDVSTRLMTFDKAFQTLGLYPHLKITASPGELSLVHPAARQ